MSEKKKIRKGFKAVVSKFPKTKLPTELNPDDHLSYAKKNKPLSNETAFDFFHEEGDQAIDEFTEFVPCFSLPGTEKFRSFVYWRADFLRYEYHIVNFTLTGDLIQKMAIAGTIVDRDELVVQVAKINSSFEIEIYSGSFPAETQKSLPAELLSKMKLSKVVKVDSETGKLILH